MFCLATVLLVTVRRAGLIRCKVDISRSRHRHEQMCCAHCGGRVLSQNTLWPSSAAHIFTGVDQRPNWSTKLSYSNHTVLRYFGTRVYQQVLISLCGYLLAVTVNFNLPCVLEHWTTSYTPGAVMCSQLWRSHFYPASIPQARGFVVEFFFKHLWTSSTKVPFQPRR